MNERQMSEISQILQECNNGNHDAKELLLPFVYDELKRQARFFNQKQYTEARQILTESEKEFINTVGENAPQTIHFREFLSMIPE